MFFACELATKSTAEKFRADPQSLKGQTILLTANSTGDYAVQSCLKKYGLAKSDVMLKNMGQAEIISAMSSNNAKPSSMLPVAPCAHWARCRTLPNGN